MTKAHDAVLSGEMVKEPDRRSSPPFAFTLLLGVRRRGAMSKTIRRAPRRIGRGAGTSPEIEGRIHDTNIPELREKLQSLPMYKPKIYPGTDIPQEDRNPYHMLGPKWFDTLVAKSKVDYQEIHNALELKPDKHLGSATGQAFRRAGILHDDGAYLLLQVGSITYRGMNYVRRAIAYKALNSGWIFDKVQPDGTFQVKLYGLVNRHIMTMVLGAATRYAKFLDSELVQRSGLTNRSARSRLTNRIRAEWPLGSSPLPLVASNTH